MQDCVRSFKIICLQSSWKNKLCYLPCLSVSWNSVTRACKYSNRPRLSGPVLLSIQAWLVNISNAFVHSARSSAMIDLSSSPVPTQPFHRRMVRTLFRNDCVTQFIPYVNILNTVSDLDARSWKAVMSWGKLRLQMGSKAEKKVVIVGKYCVGKTALVHRYTKNRFNELSSYEPVSFISVVSKVRPINAVFSVMW